MFHNIESILVFIFRFDNRNIVINIDLFLHAMYIKYCKKI